MNINQHNCSLSDATTDALFIHPHAVTVGYALPWQDQLSVPARAGQSGAPTPIAPPQWPANEQLRNRIREKEEGGRREKQEDRLPGLRQVCYSAFLNSAPRGFELVFGCHLWPTLVVQSKTHTHKPALITEPYHPQGQQLLPPEELGL